jgi:hypothetical protein
VTTALPDAQRANFENLREYLAASDFTDRAFWLGVCDRALGRDPEYDALGRILRPRRYRYAAAHGAIKALVAATPVHGVLLAQNIDHANCLRSAAKGMGRTVKVRQVIPGKPERNVTLLS